MMARKETDKDPFKEIAIKAFFTVLGLLVSVVTWVVLDMHSDLKSIMQRLPTLELRVDRLEDSRIVDRFRVHQLLPAKHEEQITLDSLTQN